MKKLALLSLAAMLALILGACSDSLDPGDDDPVDYGFTTVDNGDGSFTTTAVAEGLSGSNFIYFSLATGEGVEPANPDDADDYDLALLFANINLNGGSNGTGGVELVYFDDGNYAGLVQAPADGYITDTGNTDIGRAFNQGAVEGQNGGWYNYTGSPDHEFILAENRYYAIHGADGSYYKLRLTLFSTQGSSSPAEIVFDWQEIPAP